MFGKICVVLFSIIFTINNGILTYFFYYKYMNHDEKAVSKESFVYQTTISFNEILNI